MVLEILIVSTTMVKMVINRKTKGGGGVLITIMYMVMIFMKIAIIKRRRYSCVENDKDCGSFCK